MKIAMITNHNNYVGRQYSIALDSAGIKADKLVIGEYPEHNKIEDERCGHLWFPDFIDLNRKDVYRFKSLKGDDFLKFLEDKKYDVAIQGGTGILKQNVIEKFKFGILNFHPGDLPEYRGCMTPEWQILEGRRVISTCHLIDSGIDTGDIIAKKELDLDYSDYHKMRAGVYPETAKFVVEIIKKIASEGYIKAVKQDESIAKYREVMNKETFEKLMMIMEEKDEVLQMA